MEKIDGQKLKEDDFEHRMPLLYMFGIEWWSLCCVEGIRQRRWHRFLAFFQDDECDLV